MMPKRLAALALLAVLGGCGGGGSAPSSLGPAPVATPTHSAAQSNGRVPFTVSITIPARKSGSRGHASLTRGSAARETANMERYPTYIPVQTASMAVTVGYLPYGPTNSQSASTNCAAQASPPAATPSTCTLTFGANVDYMGPQTLTIVLSDSSGYKLAAGNQLVDVLEGAANVDATPLTLGEVIGSTSFTASPLTITENYSTSTSLTFQAFSTTSVMITSAGCGGCSLVDAAGNPQTFTFSDSESLIGPSSFVPASTTAPNATVSATYFGTPFTATGPDLFNATATTPALSSQFSVALIPQQLSLGDPGYTGEAFSITNGTPLGTPGTNTQESLEIPLASTAYGTTLSFPIIDNDSAHATGQSLTVSTSAGCFSNITPPSYPSLYTTGATLQFTLTSTSSFSGCAVTLTDGIGNAATLTLAENQAQLIVQGKKHGR